MGTAPELHPYCLLTQEGRLGPIIEEVLSIYAPGEGSTFVLHTGKPRDQLLMPICALAISVFAAGVGGIPLVLTLPDIEHVHAVVYRREHEAARRL